MLQSFFQLATDVQVKDYEIDDIPDFPAKEYRARVEYYRKMEEWYTGAALDETVSDSGEEIELYPAKINPLPSAALKHAHTLFGEVNDDSSPLVSPKFVKAEGIKDEDILHLEEVLRVIWNESAGRTVQYLNGLLSQIYGGCIFKASYVAWDKTRTYPIRFSKIHPMNFMGILYPDEEFRLSEAWYIKNVSAKVAEQYGVRLDEDESGLWVEYWNDEEYRVTINGIPVRRRYNGVEKVFTGKNVFGSVPVVYIPHERTIGLFGNSMISPLIGLVKEINARQADYGDAVSDDSHDIYAMRNASNPRVVTVGGKKYLDLGSNQSAVGMNGGDPDVFSFMNSSASEPMGKIVGELYKHYRRAAYIPAVADGEDEGSQRSGLTLAFRMWPLTSHVATERVFWTSGLNHFTRVVTRFMAKTGIGDISEGAAKAAVRQEWAPMLPRDREAMVNEAVQRITNGLGSPEAMLRLLGDTEDVDEELDLIKDWLEFKNAQQPNPFEAGGSAGSPQDMANELKTTEKPED